MVDKFLQITTEKAIAIEIDEFIQAVINSEHAINDAITELKKNNFYYTLGVS
jgi:hypothetical protein